MLRINITGQWACGVDCIIICRRCSCCWRQSSEGTCWSLSLMRFTLYFGGVCVAFALLFVALKLFFWHGLHIRGAIGDACDYYCPSRAEGMVLVLNGSRCPVLTWVNSRPHPVPRLGDHSTSCLLDGGGVFLLWQQSCKSCEGVMSLTLVWRASPSSRNCVT